jgi:predicted nucleic acid-binding protein
MMTWLVDTGPLVAFLDAADPAHDGVLTILTGFKGRLATTGPVITEVMHFVSRLVDGPTLLGEFAISAEMNVYDLCQPREIETAALMMKRYGDTPMDFADATLVLLSEALDVREILTLDRRGFSAFRDGRGRPFRQVMVR